MRDPFAGSGKSSRVDTAGLLETFGTPKVLSLGIRVESIKSCGVRTSSKGEELR
jgi:hypothetical protein